MALSINSTTGTIDLSASTAGTYTVKYSTGIGTDTTQVIIEGTSIFTNTRSGDFDGIDDYARTDAGSLMRGQANFTLMFWVKMTDTPSNEPFVHSWSSSARIYLVRYIVNTGLQFYVRNSDSTNSLITYNTTLSQNTWYHIACVKDGTTTRLYLNGSQVGTGTATANANTPSVQPKDYITAYGSTPAYSAIHVDEYASWQSVISASDISTIYNSGTPTDLSSYSPQNWYRFEEGSGTTVSNSGSLTTNDLNLFNGATFTTDVPSASSETEGESEEESEGG